MSLFTILNNFQPFIYFFFCFLSCFLDLVFHPFLFELQFLFSWDLYKTLVCFIDAIPSHCSLKIHIRTGLVAVWEVFFCLLYYLCCSQIPLFSFGFYLDFFFRMKEISLFPYLPFDCLCLIKNWLKIQRSGQDWCIVGLY